MGPHTSHFNPRRRGPPFAQAEHVWDRGTRERPPAPLRSSLVRSDRRAARRRRPSGCRPSRSRRRRRVRPVRSAPSRGRQLRALPAYLSRTARNAATSSGCAASPISSDWLSRPISNAIAARSTPIAIDAPASQRGSPVSSCMPSPAAAIATPMRPAPSSRTMVRALGSVVVRRWPNSERPRARPSDRSCLNARDSDTLSAIAPTPRAANAIGTPCNR